MIICLLNLQCWRAIIECLKGILDTTFSYNQIELDKLHIVYIPVFNWSKSTHCMFKVVNIVVEEFLTGRYLICEPNTDFTAFFLLKPIYHRLIDWSTASSEIIHFVRVCLGILSHIHTFILYYMYWLVFCIFYYHKISILTTVQYNWSLHN